MNRLGEIRENKYGEIMKIIEYNKATDITIEFLNTGFKRKTTYDKFKKGGVLSPFSKTVYKVGYLGSFYNYKGVSKLKSYSHWKNMIKRCYCEKALNVNNEYKIIKVCEEWHNFENFNKWFEDNYYEVENDVMCLDKDIKDKNSFIYSPQTCIFVPSKINLLFEKTKREKSIGRNDLPLGVRWIEVDKIYGCSCRDEGKSIWLGRSQDPMELFDRYKKCKMNIIRERLCEYDDIPQYIKNIILSYNIELTD